MTWTYVVTNTGTTALADVTVGDTPAQTIDCGNGSNVISFMLPAQSVTCTATGTATRGQYRNDSTVIGTPVAPPEGPGIDPTDPTTWPTGPAQFTPITDVTTGEPVTKPTDTDPSHYYGGNPIFGSSNRSACSPMCPTATYATMAIGTSTRPSTTDRPRPGESR